MTEQTGVIAEQAQAPWARPASPDPATTATWPEHWGAPRILPSQMLREAEQRGIIATSDGGNIPEAQFQPASIDLRLGDKAYRLRTSFLPGADKVEERMQEYQLDNGFDIGPKRGGGILERGRAYLIPLMENLHLPHHICAYANPKSSTGRVDVFTRVVSDKSKRFDEIRAGYEGNLWLEVFTRSFLVKVRAGMALSQLRLITTTGQDMPAIKPDFEKSLHIDLSPMRMRDDSESQSLIPIGFMAKESDTELLDLSRNDHDPRRFWEPIFPEEGKIMLEPEKFYLLRSQERITIPHDHAAEMVAFDAASGELRTHYAGFFDPGFGGSDSRNGLPVVLEVRAHDVPFMLEDGQEVARLRYQRLAKPSDHPYGHEAGSHYDGERQWRFLSKHFRPWSQLPLRF